ncbi:hypothetical protein ABLE91_15785 [Aquabacter sp. CN5-332]|uniref:hypothetical protein n=1 Tax=Aquabacter sp. CN5-332 TaxID=3156608 RepID=UPI0032B4604D
MKTENALLCALSCAALLASAPLAPAAAQTSGPSSSGCEVAQGTAPTPTAHGAHSGTQPGSSGSTAWSGGTGGSNIGTTPGAPTPGSPTDHPPTVQGVSPSVVGPVRKDC